MKGYTRIEKGVACPTLKIVDREVIAMYQELLFYYYYKRQKAYLKNHPLRVWIEPTNACNLRCRTCPQSVDGFPMRGMMDVELMKKIAIDLRTIHPRMVTLHLSGEPLLHPEIARLVRILKQEDLAVTFSTNGLLLTRSKVEGLIEAGLDDIRIDFAANKERYEEIRQEAVWEVVYNNILTLLEVKRQKGLFNPRVLLVNMDITDDEGETAHNLAQLKDLFKDYTVEVLNLGLHTWAGEFAQKAKEDPLFKELSLLHEGRGKYFPCPHIFGSFVVTWDGDVVPCCRDLKKDYIIGNIKEHSIMELWNSDRMLQLRRKQILKQYNDIPLCRDCTQLWANYSLFKLAKNSLQRFFYLKFGHSPEIIRK